MLRVAQVYIGLRVLLAACNPDLWQVLDSFVELSTPISSFKRLCEGLFLYNTLQDSPYNGGPCHHSPLLLSLFTAIPLKYTFAVFTAADVLAASALAAFAAKHPKISFSPEIVAVFYLFNPFNLLSSLAQSTNVITNALICAALYSATVKEVQSVVFLAAATAFSWYPAYLLPPFILLAATGGGGSSDGGNSSSSTTTTVVKRGLAIKLVLLYLGFTAAFLGLAYIPTQSWDFVESQFGTLILLGDLTQPNLGLWWYFFIELFDFFRPFFLGAFQLVLLAFTAPLTIRFADQPLFVIGALTGIMAVFKPYPEASDFGLYLSLLVLNKQVLELLDYYWLEALGICYVTALAPVFHYLWIYAGSGNANFFYAITLVYAVTMIVMLSDTTWAAIRIGFDGGKTRNLAQI